MSVSREMVARVVGRFPIGDAARATDAIARLLEALAAEPDPPTTVRAPAEALDVHIADSLAGLELVSVREARRAADIGSGAGFPGLALAAALPDLRVDLIESGRRKCEVIDRLATAAGIAKQARAVPARAEDWAKTEEGREAYDLVTARALASLPVICEYAAPLLRSGGALVAWKGARDPDEEAAGQAASEELGLIQADVIGAVPFPSSRNRHLYVYSKVRKTPDRYPRRAGMATKKPLA